MIDVFTAASPTYRAAKATDQSRGRGWAFEPAARRRLPIHTLRVIAQLAAISGVVACFWIVLS